MTCPNNLPISLPNKREIKEKKINNKTSRKNVIMFKRSLSLGEILINKHFSSSRILTLYNTDNYKSLSYQINKDNITSDKLFISTSINCTISKTFKEIYLQIM